MNWQPLTRVFCAESYEDGVDIAHTFDAPDVGSAVVFAEKRGWTFIGELISEIDNEMAMLEGSVSVIH